MGGKRKAQRVLESEKPLERERRKKERGWWIWINYNWLKTAGRSNMGWSSRGSMKSYQQQALVCAAILIPLLAACSLPQAVFTVTPVPASVQETRDAGVSSTPNPSPTTEVAFQPEFELASPDSSEPAITPPEYQAAGGEITGITESELLALRLDQWFRLYKNLNGLEGQPVYFYGADMAEAQTNYQTAMQEFAAAHPEYDCRQVQHQGQVLTYLFHAESNSVSWFFNQDGAIAYAEPNYSDPDSHLGQIRLPDGTTPQFNYNPEDQHWYLFAVDADGVARFWFNTAGATADNLDTQWQAVTHLPELFVHDQLIQLETQTVVEAVPPLWTFNPEGQPARLDTASLNYFQDEASGWVYGLNANGAVEVFGYPKTSDHLENLNWVVVTDSETPYHNLPVSVGSAMQPGESLNRFTESNEHRYILSDGDDYSLQSLSEVEAETRQLLTPEELALDTGAEINAAVALRAAVVLSQVNGNTPFTLEELQTRLDAGETVSLNIPGSDRPWLVNRGVVVIHSAAGTLPFGNVNNGRNWQGVDASGRWIVMSTYSDLHNRPVPETQYRTKILSDGLYFSLIQLMTEDQAEQLVLVVDLLAYSYSASPPSLKRLLYSYTIDLTQE